MLMKFEIKKTTKLGVQGHYFYAGHHGACSSHFRKAGEGGCLGKTVMLRVTAAVELWNYFTSPLEFFILFYKNVTSVMKESKPKDRPPTCFGRLRVRQRQLARGSNKAVMLQRMCPVWVVMAARMRENTGSAWLTLKLCLHFRGHGVWSGSLCTLSLTRGFLMPQRTSPGCEPYSRFWNMLPGY